MFRLKKRISLLCVIVLIVFVMLGIQNARCETSNKALEQRIENIERRLESTENTVEKTVSESGILGKLSLGGLIAGAYQHQNVDDAPGFNNAGRGAFVFQPEIGFTLSEADEIFTKFGFAAGNALNDGTSPFTFTSWAADLEDDVKDINGRNRDYLLTAWYKHTFTFSEKNTLGITGGLVDATDYLDENAYANDGFTQFMNQVLGNAANGFAPSYDMGAVAEWEFGQFTLKGVAMSVGENDDGRSYNFYGTNMGYTINTKLGEGHYRVNVEWTSKDFNNFAGDNVESKQCVILSFDQQLGEILGAWIRFGWQDDDAAIICKSLYSGGLDINGKLWRREQDNIGIGYAYLKGGNQDLDNAYVFETYVRFLLNEYFAITADLQYQDNNMKQGTCPSGFISGVRCVVEF
ncbi:MAG: carbohydrate porin [Desulfobacterales bacterium]|nr:carbohydrate porin [Desulfobacterales bacterium]